jgi:hypothetical protein
MSDARRSSAFYGEGRPLLYGALSSLDELIGYSEWPDEIVFACAYVQLVCDPAVVLMKMPAWVC